MHKFWGYYATGSGDSDAAVVPWLHSFFHSQFILLFATFCPLKINTITIEIFFFDWFSLLILFNSYLSCFCFFFLSALLLGIPLQNAVSFYGCFCSYFYLCVLGDLTPEGDFEKKVDRSHKKNRKACEARKARITFYWCNEVLQKSWWGPLIQWLTKLSQCFVVLYRWTWCGVMT